MSVVEKTIFYIFILSLVLIALAYYAGLQTDVGAFQGFVSSLINTSTGRNAQGNFASYPGGYQRVG